MGNIFKLLIYSYLKEEHLYRVQWEKPQLKFHIQQNYPSKWGQNQVNQLPKYFSQRPLCCKRLLRRIQGEIIYLYDYIYIIIRIIIHIHTVDCWRTCWLGALSLHSWKSTYHFWLPKNTFCEMLNCFPSLLSII